MFAAIISRDGGTPPQAWASGESLLGALFPFTQPDVSGVWSDDRTLIAHGVIHNTPESLHERAPEICRDTGRVIASWVRLDNRQSLCDQLGIEHRHDLTDPQIILAAHRKWGRDCAAKLEGDFSFVIYDPASGETYCARDTIGARPLFYMITDKVFVAATSVAAMRVLRGDPLKPDIRWAAMFLVMLNFLHDQSAYQNVRKLPPGHDLVLNADATQEPREYFQFDLTSPTSTERNHEWVDTYREVFDHAVKVRARSSFLVGAESSGGLDSSSVVSALVDHLPHSQNDFHCFGLMSFEFEPDLLLATAAMRHIRHTHILGKPQMLRQDHVYDRTLKALGHPPEHWQMIGHPSFFELSEALGIRTLMSGYGGDEIVTSHAHHLVPELLSRREYKAVLDEMPGPLPMRLARLGKRMVTGVGDANSGALDVLQANFRWACINRDVYEELGFAEQLEQWIAPETEPTVNQVLANSPGFKLGRTARLESASIFAATYGMEYRWPMYDRALLQQYFSTPAIEKRRKTMGRYLHKRAMQGRIPERILWQRGKHLGNHIGGHINVEHPQPIEFEALPEMLRILIDKNAYGRRTDYLKNSQKAADEQTINAHVFDWQLRQLASWLS